MTASTGPYRPMVPGEPNAEKSKSKLDSHPPVTSRDRFSPARQMVADSVLVFSTGWNLLLLHIIETLFALFLFIQFPFTKYCTGFFHLRSFFVSIHTCLGGVVHQSPPSTNGAPAKNVGHVPCDVGQGKKRTEEAATCLSGQCYRFLETYLKKTFSFFFLSLSSHR
jgi:hypothetical protein